MKKRGWRFSPKWLILGLLLALVPLYQNMSPMYDYVDLRLQAPRKPAGTWDQPLAGYVPRNFAGRSLNDLGQGLLSYNFDPMLKELERSYLQSSPKSFVAPDENELAPNEVLEDKAKWGLDLVNSSKLRLTFQKQMAGQNMKFICESQSGTEGLSLRMARPLSSNLNMEFRHETSRSESQLQIDYQW